MPWVVFEVSLQQCMGHLTALGVWAVYQTAEVRLWGGEGAAEDTAEGALSYTPPSPTHRKRDKYTHTHTHVTYHKVSDDGWRVLGGLIQVIQHLEHFC